MAYVYTGVENTNGNRYDVTITPQEFMQRIDLSKVENDRQRELFGYILGAVNDKYVPTKFEHVDTYLREDGMWRVQIWLNLNPGDIKDNYESGMGDLYDFFSFAEDLGRIERAGSRFHFYNPYCTPVFHGVLWFEIPAKD